MSAMCVCLQLQHYGKGSQAYLVLQNLDLITCECIFGLAYDLVAEWYIEWQLSHLATLKMMLSSYILYCGDQSVLLFNSNILLFILCILAT